VLAYFHQPIVFFSQARLAQVQTLSALPHSLYLKRNPFNVGDRLLIVNLKISDDNYPPDGWIAWHVHQTTRIPATSPSPRRLNARLFIAVTRRGLVWLRIPTSRD
jgi:hypothetical protein